jgi:hypothetical protein
LRVGGRWSHSELVMDQCPEKGGALSVGLGCTPCCSWEGPRPVSMAGNASSHRYGGMAVGRSRLGDLEGKRSAHTRQKTEIAETLACVGLPPIKHTVFSAIDLPCSMPLPGAGGKDQLNLRLGLM